MNAVLSEKGQVTIPKAIRDDLGLTAGCLLDFTEDHGQIIVRKVMPQNPISAWRGRGKLPIGNSVNDYLKASRGGA
jgi:AbrB family looped-hinge helix DNA binding protein